jgi:hypothetical protein
MTMNQHGAVRLSGLRKRYGPVPAGGRGGRARRGGGAARAQRRGQSSRRTGGAGSATRRWHTAAIGNAVLVLAGWSAVLALIGARRYRAGLARA